MKPVNRYRATFADRCTGAAESLVLEAKSDRGAARIAAGYEESGGEFMCRLVGLSRWRRYFWQPVPAEVVEKATNFPKEVVYASR